MDDKHTKDETTEQQASEKKVREGGKKRKDEREAKTKEAAASVTDKAAAPPSGVGVQDESRPSVRRESEERSPAKGTSSKDGGPRQTAWLDGRNRGSGYDDD